MNEESEKLFEEISRKLNVLISLSLRNLLQDKRFAHERKKGTGEIANYLANFSLDSEDIAEILGAPIQSVRTLLTPKRRR